MPMMNDLHVRDWYAKEAMGAIMVSRGLRMTKEEAELIANEAFIMADAMVKARWYWPKETRHDGGEVGRGADGS